MSQVVPLSAPEPEQAVLEVVVELLVDIANAREFVDITIAAAAAHDRVSNLI